MNSIHKYSSKYGQLDVRLIISLIFKSGFLSLVLTHTLTSTNTSTQFTRTLHSLLFNFNDRPQSFNFRRSPAGGK